MANDYQKAVAINSSEIDRELEQHGQKFMEWVEHYAAAEKEILTAERNLKVVKAQLEIKIKENPEKYGIEKVTEGTVKAKIRVSKKFAEASERFEQAKYDLEVMRGMREEMGHHRKKALEKLVDLMLNGIFSDPKTAKADGERKSRLTKKLRRH